MHGLWLGRKLTSLPGKFLLWLTYTGITVCPEAPAHEHGSDIFHRNPSVVNSSRAISISFRSSVQWFYIFTFISFSLQTHGFQELFFFCIAVKKADLTQFPLISFLSSLHFSWHYKGLNLSDLISLSFIWITNILISFWSRFLSIGLLQMAAAAISVYNLMTSWRLRLVITI